MTSPPKKTERPDFTGDTLYGLPISAGTHQEDRLPLPLQSDWFNLEEHSPDTLLTMSGQYASMLRYFSNQNQERGDWAPLFRLDESAIMAEMLTPEGVLKEEDFLRCLQVDSPSAAQAVLRMAEKVDNWLDRLSGMQYERIGRLLEQIDERAPELISRLDNLLLFLSRHHLTKHEKKEGYARRFRRLRSRARQSSPPPQATPVSADGLEGKEFLLATYASFNEVLLRLQKTVPFLRQDALHSGQHDPAMGLFIAFLQLYCKAVAKDRSFPERHLDFYYQEVLRTGPCPPQPDSILLVCRSTPGNQALVNRGDRFTSGTGPTGEERLYIADHALRVTDTRIARLLTLSFERDRLISPAWEMGCFTRCRINELTAAAEPEPDKEPASLPLFGDAKRLVRRYGAHEAQLGLALAAPELLLSQGRREIELTLFYKETTNKETILKEMKKTVGQESFFALFGKLLTLYLTPTDQEIPVAEQKHVRAAARAAGVPKASRDLCVRLMEESNEGNTLFYRFLTNAFYIDLSGESGWLPVEQYMIYPMTELEPGCSGGIRLRFTLDRDAEAVIGYQQELHGSGYNTTLPLLRLRLNHQAHFFTYSIFRSCILRKIILETKVEGLRDLQAYNQHGQLDPTQPFQPFGPMPTRQSYLIVGSREAACKQLTELRFNIEWGELPEDDEGFSTHYRGYKNDSLTNASFRADFSLLRNGHWIPKTKEQRHSAPLFDWQAFAADPQKGKLKEQQHLTVRDVKKSQPINTKTAPEDYFYGPRQNNGFFRWQLSGSTFGQSEYPELLSRIMILNARSKKLNLPVPKAPYTPQINRLSLDYTARNEIDLDTAAEGEARLYHLHPFGLKTLYPGVIRKPHALVPDMDASGNLYIGLRSQELNGLLTLYFSLTPDSGRTAADEEPNIRWHYATDTDWSPFPEAKVQEDSTNSFLHSGIITLDIPADISKKNEEMGQGLYWLRASTDNTSRYFSSLRGVYTQALRATASQNNTVTEALPPQSVQQSQTAITGLTEVFQPEASFNSGRQEDREAVVTRLHERLRHKDRAVTPWDYERLVLEHFPDIGQVKCFPHLRTRPKPGPCPGGVLITVVPDENHKATSDNHPRINAAQLIRIQDFLQKRSSPFTRIEVRNPEYEQIQVRCAATFVDRAGSGLRINQLNQAVIDYISPWNPSGYHARFGWSLRLDDILAYLSEQEGVSYITDLSVLHITKDASNAYYMADSMQNTDAQDDRIRPRYPWSLAVPMQRHFIRALDEVQEVKAEMTGVDEVRIGTTFIINE